MTGFGTTNITFRNIKGVVEVKSVNHRYLDLDFSLPMGFSSVENKVRQIISTAISRGHVYIAVKITQKAPQTIRFNKEIAKQYVQQANVLKKELKLSEGLTVSRLLSLPGIIEIKEEWLDAQQSWSTIEKGLRSALKGLNTMRLQEGRSLVKDISGNLGAMTLQIKQVQKRIKELLADKKKNSTSEEFSSYQKSIDVNEEIARLAHYIKEVKKLMFSDIPTGKKIDFIAQEMQRETNTIGSKLPDTLVSNAVIMLKSKIEKIREQAQNIE